MLLCSVDVIGGGGGGSGGGGDDVGVGVSVGWVLFLWLFDCSFALLLLSFSVCFMCVLH